jgi:hypothetical protein
MLMFTVRVYLGRYCYFSVTTLPKELCYSEKPFIVDMYCHIYSLGLLVNSKGSTTVLQSYSFYRNKESLITTYALYLYRGGTR